MLRTGPAARLAAGTGVGIRRDGATQTPPSRPGRGARGAFARAGRRRAVEQDPVRRWALGPLPDGRPVAVPARRGGPWDAPALLPPELQGGLVAGVGAERVERGGRLRGLDARLDRLVPEGLRAAR